MMTIGYPVPETSANVKESLKQYFNIVLDRHVLIVQQEAAHIPGRGSLSGGGNHLPALPYCSQLLLHIHFSAAA